MGWWRNSSGDNWDGTNEREVRPDEDVAERAKKEADGQTHHQPGSSHDRQKMNEYDDRPRAIAAEHTRGVLQSPVLYVDAWKTFGLGMTDTVSGERSLKVQANLYCTCFSPDNKVTLAYQATIMMPIEAAIRLGQELMLHGRSTKDHVGAIPDDQDLATRTSGLITKRLGQLQAELQEMEVIHRKAKLEAAEPGSRL